jgi:predicted ATPase
VRSRTTPSSSRFVGGLASCDDAPGARRRGEGFRIRDAKPRRSAEAGQIGAKSLELRAAMCLARMLNKRGNLTEARDLIAPLYASFTEGFETADLEDAKTLLKELN